MRLLTIVFMIFALSGCIKTVVEVSSEQMNVICGGMCDGFKNVEKAGVDLLNGEHTCSCYGGKRMRYERIDEDEDE